MKNLANSVSQTDWFKEAVRRHVVATSNVDQFIRLHFVYMTEPYEIILSPDVAMDRLLAHGYFVGDCDDVATLTAAIFKTFELPTRYVAIRTQKGNPEYLHVFVEVFQDGHWIIYDATVPRTMIPTDYGRLEYLI